MCFMKNDNGPSYPALDDFGFDRTAQNGSSVSMMKGFGISVGDGEQHVSSLVIVCD